jgi:hypothetical protein
MLGGAMVATPTDYIFTPGTCLKKDFYNVLKTALTNAGWINVTSNYTTDGDVFISKGNSEDKTLVINLKPTQYNVSIVDHTYDVDTTVFCWASIRFPKAYTPGTPGSPGTFVRPDTWVTLTIAPYNWNTGLAMDTTYYYKMYVDKSKIIYSIEYPSGLSIAPILMYIGLPDNTYSPEKGNRGMVFVTTTISPGNPMVADKPDDMGISASSYLVNNICTLATRNPNNAGKYAVSEMYYGSTTEGVRGKLDGVLALPNNNVNTGNLIRIGTNTYYALVCSTYGGNAFPSNVLAIRIA